MKKLMIAAAIVCVAALSQAAQVSWVLSNKDTMRGVSAASESWSSKDVYLILATEGDAYNTFKADIASGKINASNVANLESNPLYLGTATTGTGKSAGKFAAAASSNSSALLTNGNPYDLVFVAFETQGGQDYYYISETKQGSAWVTDSEKDLATPAKWSSWSNNWAQVQSGPSPVPEPTSGLLLLLGVAGLALKRKRA